MTLSMRLGSGYFDICFDKRIRINHKESIQPTI